MEPCPFCSGLFLVEVLPYHVEQRHSEEDASHFDEGSVVEQQQPQYRHDEEYYDEYDGVDEDYDDDEEEEDDDDDGDDNSYYYNRALQYARDVSLKTAATTTTTKSYTRSKKNKKPGHQEIGDWSEFTRGFKDNPYVRLQTDSKGSPFRQLKVRREREEICTASDVTHVDT